VLCVPRDGPDKPREGGAVLCEPRDGPYKPRDGGAE
jgi:hypothetical protein